MKNPVDTGEFMDCVGSFKLNMTASFKQLSFDTIK